MQGFPNSGFKLTSKEGILKGWELQLNGSLSWFPVLSLTKREHRAGAPVLTKVGRHIHTGISYLNIMVPDFKDWLDLSSVLCSHPWTHFRTHLKALSINQTLQTISKTISSVPSNCLTKVGISLIRDTFFWKEYILTSLSNFAFFSLLLIDQSCLVFFLHCFDILCSFFNNLTAFLQFYQTGLNSLRREVFASPSH